MREITADEAGLAHAQRAQMLEHALAIVERAERIHNQDHIEWSGQLSYECAILDIADEEREMRMGPARYADHACAEIHADSIGRFQRSEQLAGPTPELEHAGALPNQEPEIKKILGMEKGGAREPFLAFRCGGIGNTAKLLLAR